MRRKGFSLVELMTVIAIMAILFAVLLPVFIQVRSYAHQYMAGQSMMKLGTSTTMYMGDHDDTYPMAFYQLPNGQRQNWFGIVKRDGSVDPETSVLAPYVKGKIQPDNALNAKPWQGDETGYGYNWGYLGSDYYTSGSRSNMWACSNPAQASSLNHPSETIVYGTSIFYFAKWMKKGDGESYRYGFIDPPRAWFGNPTLEFRHMGERFVDSKKREVTYTGQALVVYADSHLKTIHQKKVKNRMFERYSSADGLEDDHYFKR
jgi:prepilin-type N-terminal cleavage/methylation domain-containing protein